MQYVEMPVFNQVCLVNTFYGTGLGTLNGQPATSLTNRPRKEKARRLVQPAGFLI
jgi:hypothetical protein